MRTLLALSARVASAGAARADEEPAPNAEAGPNPVAPADASIAPVASGGVSLGAYQAGFLYNFAAPRQEEKIRLRIQARGYGEPPRLTNYVDPRFHLEQVVLC